MNFFFNKTVITLSLWVTLYFYCTASFAQQGKDEHASHHPKNSQIASVSPTQQNIVVANNDGVSNLSVDSVGQTQTSVMSKGPGMGKKMNGMMEQMGAPKPKDLYPTLMRLSKLPPHLADEVLQKAINRMQKGNQIMVDGFMSLANADGQQNYSEMQSSIEKIEQGLSQYNSGLATKRAIAEGQEPRRVALQWFKSQMNLLPTVPKSEQSNIFGISILHFGVMTILFLFAFVFIWVYAFKMKRASALLEELKVAPVKEPQVIDNENKKEVSENINNSPTFEKSSELNGELVTSNESTNFTSKKKGVFKGTVYVIGIFNETHDVKTIRLASLAGEPLPFNYEPGQFVTFSLNIPNQPKVIKRSYTIASSPTQRDYFEVTIKREEQGLVSRFMHDNVCIGDALEIKAPNGKFYFNGNNEENIVLVSGGVGITPMMSAVRYLTSTCWKGNIYFLFCARTSNDFIFERELRYLQSRHKNLHVLVSMTRVEGTAWMGPQGRFTSQLVNDFVPELSEKTAHICGPPPMMDAMKNMLIELGMMPQRVKIEAFGGSSPVKKENKPQSPIMGNIDKNTSIKAEAINNGFEVSFTQSNKHAKAAEGESILDVAENLDVDIDSSCRAGSCGSCKVKLLEGQVEMDVDDGLEEDDKENGYVLACQSIPKTPVKVEV